MTHTWKDLADGEVRLTDEAENLWRQVAPGHLQQDGTISYLVFRPTERDARKLSVRRSSRIDAKAAFEEHIANGSTSLGSLAVIVEEVHRVGLRAIDDSGLEPDLPTGHAYVDFRPLTKRETNAAADALLRLAQHRGLIYRGT